MYGMIIFSAGWSTYEEGKTVEIQYFKGIYTCRTSGYLIYLGSFDDTEVIEEQEAIEIIEDCIQSGDYDIEF